MITVSTFYQFTPLPDPSAHKAALLAHMQALDVKGTVTLAQEGVNATVSGEAEALGQFIEALKTQLGTQVPMVRDSHTAAQPFMRS